MFLSRLNKLNGGRGNICLVSGSLRRILKFLGMTFLSARLCGWSFQLVLFLITPTKRSQFEDYPYATGTQKAAKVSNKNSSFNWVHSIHTGSKNASHSTNLFTNLCHHISTNAKAPRQPRINQQHPTIPLFALTKGERSKRQRSKSFQVVIQPLLTRLIKTKFCCTLYSQLVAHLLFSFIC